jgi:predicted secreted protein
MSFQKRLQALLLFLFRCNREKKKETKWEGRAEISMAGPPFPGIASD